MNATYALLPFEVTTMASVLVAGLWLVAIVAAIYRWRVFDKIRVVYRFATEFERRVHRRFSDSTRQRSPFGSVLSKIADASTAALVETEGGKAARRLAKRYEKNRGDEMLALLQRTLIGEAGGWTPTPDDATSQLPTIGHAVRFALNENPVLARLGFTSLSFAHRASECAPWALCALSSAASATLVALALQLVGGPEVFLAPSFVGFAVCLAPIVSAALLGGFLYVFYRFFDPDRLYDRTVQKLTGSLEVLWQDASQQRPDSEFRLPSDVNAPVPEDFVDRLPEQEAMSAEDVRFLTGDRARSRSERERESEHGPTAEVADVSPDASEAPVSDAPEPEDEPEEITLLSDLPTAGGWDPPGELTPQMPVAEAEREPPPPAPAPVPVPEAPLETLSAPAANEEDWSLAAPMKPQAPIGSSSTAHPAVTAGGVGGDDEGPSTMPEFTLPKELGDVPSPLWPDALSAPITAPAPAPEPPLIREERTEWASSLEPLPVPPTAPAIPEEPVREEVTLWNATPIVPAPAPPEPRSAKPPEVKEEPTLWNPMPAPVSTPAAAPAKPTVTVRRAASTPAATPSGENTGEWSLSGSHDLRAEAPAKEEITQEVPLRPVAASGAGSGSPAVVRRPAPAPAEAPTPAPAPAPAADGNLWNTATPALTGGDDDRLAVLRHRLSMVEQYLQKATADFSQGAISEAMWQEETERWSLEREKLVRELAQLVAKKKASNAA